MNSRQNIHISARLKPSTSREIAIEIQSNLILINQSKTQKQFLFDQIFQPYATQQSIYESIGFQLVERVVEGFHATILSYGQTAAGKTFTIYGNPTNYGIVPRAARHLLDIKDADNMRFILRVGCVQIYNEQVRDLLDQCERKHIKESKEGVYVKNMVKTLIKTYDDFRQVLNIVDTMRSTFETCMNAESSRSHCILTFYLEIAEQMNGQQIYKEGRLHCVDLAGSERQKKTGSLGLRLKQANSINKNLVVLRNVIHALIENKQHIPYRDCKLTRLLKDSFGGSTKTKLVANISTDESNLQQTISTLRYAAVVSKITNCPKIHYDAKDLLIKQYIEEIKRLKQQQSSNFQSNELMEHSKLLFEKHQITQALQFEQHENQELKNRIDALARLINPNPLPPLDKKKFNQYRKRKLQQLSEKQSILEKSKQQIRQAEIEFEAQFSIHNDNILQNQEPDLDIQKLKQKYRVLKSRYINLKDQMKLKQNDFQEERDYYESKISILERDNMFYKNVLERYTTLEQLAQMKSSTAEGSHQQFQLPFRQPRQAFNRASSIDSEESIFKNKVFHPGMSRDGVQIKNAHNEQYFSIERQQLCNAEFQKRSKSKSLSRKQRFKPLKSPRFNKASTQPASTFEPISPKPKTSHTKFNMLQS